MVERSSILFLVHFSVCFIHSIDAEGKKIVGIDSDEMKAFRAKSYVEPVNGLQDLNSNSTEMIATLEKIKELEHIGFDLLNTVPENGATCSVQAKYYISAIIDRAKEQCDYCVVRHLVSGSRKEMNQDQKDCSIEHLETAQQELNKLSNSIDECRHKT